ncbi:hypothetical protein [Aquimarina brevivitae]|uniref:Uncharacterized protein n=1 Tax=Aquimarina brevivitae TaxID=323412 RepID=A0A4Q7PK24_9FLAO|nr:hypothetical protein [Aquimarina brevivitae]RZT00191.1 hypothetical protein EV197_1426 [Aquimarina brevivitae]
MKLKTLQLAVVTLIALVLGITSCTKEDLVTEKSLEEIDNTMTKESTSAMLKFGSIDEMNSYVEEKMNSEIDLLEEARYEIDKNGRIPLLLVYNLEEEGEVEQLGIDQNNIPVVDSPDDMLLFLLNEKGEISIEDYIFRVDGDFVFRYHPNAAHTINEFLEVYNSDEIRIEPEKVLKFNEHLSVYKHNNPSSLKGSNTSKSFANHYYTNPFNGTNKYMVSQFWNNRFWFYQSIGASTSVKRPKRWYEFWHFAGDPNVKADNRLKYNISFSAAPLLGMGSPTTLTFNGFNDCNNCKKVQRVFHWTVGFSEDPKPLYTEIDGKTQHWAHWYSANPNTVSRTITP